MTGELLAYHCIAPEALVLCGGSFPLPQIKCHRKLTKAKLSFNLRLGPLIVGMKGFTRFFEGKVAHVCFRMAAARKSALFAARQPRKMQTGMKWS